MKIAIISHCKPGNVGGIETYIYSLYSLLKKEKNIEPILLENQFPNKNFFIKIILIIMYVYKLIRVKPNCVHVHNDWYPTVAALIYKKINPAAKIIITFHSYISHDYSFIKKNLLKKLYNSADYITFVAKGLEQNINSKIPLNGQISYITYPGVTIRRVSKKDKKLFIKKFNVDKNKTILLSQGFTANHYKAEGIKILLNAMKILKEKSINTLLILTKKGKYNEDIKNYADMIGMGNSIIMAGNMSNPFIPLEVCDIYCQITLADGLPLSILEAMYKNKPIIATSIGSIPEALNESNSILVKPNSEEIAQKIEYLINNKKFSMTISKKARIDVKKNFKWSSTISIFLKMYKGEL